MTRALVTGATGYIGSLLVPRLLAARRLADDPRTAWRSVSGVALGILLLAILRNGLNLLGVSPYFFQIVIGVVLLASTGITGLSLRRRRVAEAA